MNVTIRRLGLQPYEPCFEAMKSFTESRDDSTEDEIWFLQHSPVYTQGRAGKAEHILNPEDIPVIQIDRGGQITFHGPGQLTAYLLLDIKRLGLGVRELVTTIEESIVESLRSWDIPSAPRPDAPGVYVDGAKIAALGLRIRRGCSYHGLSLNMDMDMEPWNRINPCGLSVPVTQIADFVSDCPSSEDVIQTLAGKLVGKLGYNEQHSRNEFPPGLS